MKDKQTKFEFQCLIPWNKWAVGILMVFILGLSTVFIGVELNNNEGPTDESVEMVFDNIDGEKYRLKNDTINCCRILLSEQKTKTKNYTSKVLLYTSFIIIVSISLIGLFVVLLKILHTEEEERKTVNKVVLDLYKEEQSRRISSEKTDMDKLKKYDEILKKIELLEQNIEFVKSIHSHDENEFIKKLKDYIS